MSVGWRLCLWLCMVKVYLMIVTFVGDVIVHGLSLFVDGSA